MDIREIRKLDIKDIYKEINKSQVELLKRKIVLKLQITQKSSSEGVNVSEISKMKKYIAMLHTVLNEKNFSIKE